MPWLTICEKTAKHVTSSCRISAAACLPSLNNANPQVSDRSQAHGAITGSFLSAFSSTAAAIAGHLIVLYAKSICFLQQRTGRRHAKYGGRRQGGDERDVAVVAECRCLHLSLHWNQGTLFPWLSSWGLRGWTAVTERLRQLWQPNRHQRFHFSFFIDFFVVVVVVHQQQRRKPGKENVETWLPFWCNNGGVVWHVCEHVFLMLCECAGNLAGLWAVWPPPPCRSLFVSLPL